MAERITVAACSGKGVILAPGQAVKVINTFGTQVVDTWAVSVSNPRHYLSMSHTRAVLERLIPRAGDRLVNEDREPMLVLERDETPGVHDTLVAACDPSRFRLLGIDGYHASCAENFHRALAEVDLELDHVPQPFNLFMNIPWTQTGEISIEPPVTKPGDYVLLRAQVPCAVALSACPQDVVPINGAGCKPQSFELEILEQGES